MRVRKGRVTVEERTYIQSNSNLVAGRKSTIMIGENCKLAHNVTIGVCAVVTKSVKSNTIVGRIPAKLIRRKYTI